jgi:hypothetical protein
MGQQLGSEYNFAHYYGWCNVLLLLPHLLHRQPENTYKQPTILKPIKNGADPYQH